MGPGRPRRRWGSPAPDGHRMSGCCRWSWDFFVLTIGVQTRSGDSWSANTAELAWRSTTVFYPFPRTLRPVRRRFSSSTCESLQLSTPQQETYNATVTSWPWFRLEVVKVRKGGLTLRSGSPKKSGPYSPCGAFSGRQTCPDTPIFPVVLI